MVDRVAGQRRYALKTRALLIVIGLLAFLLYLCFLVPFNDVVETVQRANLFYFLLAFCLLFVSAAFSSLTWQRLLSLLSVKTHFLKTYQFIWVENFVDLVVPGEPISGDTSRAYLMSKESGESYGKVVASVVGHRILATTVAAGGLIISIVYFAIRYKPPMFVLEFAAIVALGDAVLVALLFFVGTRRGATGRIVNWLINLLVRLSRGRWRLERLKEPAAKMLGVFHEEVTTLGKHPKGLILPVLFSIFAWLLDAFIAILVFLSLGFLGAAISFSAVIIVYSISGAIQNIPIGVIPGEVGLTEIVMTTLFTLLGNPQAIAVFAVATVLIRVLTLWTKLVVGGTVVQLLGIRSLVPPVEAHTQNDVPIQPHTHETVQKQLTGQNDSSLTCQISTESSRYISDDCKTFLVATKSRLKLAQ